MIHNFKFKDLFLLVTASTLFATSNPASSAAFQLWEEDAASIGNYHAGVAAIANDASTNWYNAAGLTRIKNQQVVFGIDPIITRFPFRGTVDNHGILTPTGDALLGPQPVSVDGGNTSYVPSLHYAAPISDCVAFGLSITAPFGLKTDYGSTSFSRYAATLTKVQVMNVGPSLAFAPNDRLSLGVGFDWQRLTAELNKVAGAIDPSLDTRVHNTGWSNGWGYHAGILYQLLPTTRVGLSYRSKISHRVTGHSDFSGPIANSFTGGTQRSDNFKARATLPALTSIGVFHTLNTCWDLLGHISFTQWNVFDNLTLENVAGLDVDLLSTNALVVTIPEHYRNSWNYSIGANYHPCSNWVLRTGLGYDQSPTSDRYRNLQLPDSDRIALGLGGHYQFNKCIGVDVGYTHVFSMKTRINNLTQVFGPEEVTTNGSVNSSADVFGLGLKWDIA